MPVSKEPTMTVTSNPSRIPTPAKRPTQARGRTPRHRGEYALVLVLLVLGIYLPIANTAIDSASVFHLSLFSINMLGQIMCFAMLALALDFVWGLAGILSLGHGIFFGIGGYAMGFYLLNGAYADTGVLPDFMLYMGWKEFPALLQAFARLDVAIALAIGGAIAIAGLFGLSTFGSRINGVYFSIITQALTYALMLLLFINDLGLGGNNGLTGFTSIAGHPLARTGTQVGLASLACVCLAIVFLVLRLIADSSFGQTLVGVRDDEARLRFMGYRTDRIKLFAWVLSAAVAALAGLLYVPQVGIVNPTIVAPMLSVEIAVWVAIGGRGSLIGAILGAVLVNGLKFWLSALVPSAWPFILAGVTLLITVALSNGLWSGVRLLTGRRNVADKAA
ncbi:MAG: urea transport system permease protein [Bradyrhizobium sp.]|jgi:urea transport system permease protein